MKDWQAEKQWYTKNKLAKRQIWYADVAADYERVRQRYPDSLIDGAIAAAGLSPQAHLLEIGCGPGIATCAWADRGYQLTCIEPNSRFYAIMQSKCALYPQVQVENVAFEQWTVQPGQFDAVLAANSLHWVEQDVAYLKAAQALRPGGHLVELFHLTPEPNPWVFELLRPAYAALPPWFAYEGETIQRINIEGLGQELLDSGYFQDLVVEITPWSQLYNTTDYLALLGTLSTYIRLTALERDRLFKQLQFLIDTELGGEVEVFNLCAFQVGTRID
ncbi:MAG: class I SAM-dependent methyltransferase [Spirulina sp. SIO3F2]|nr:class I SAM-dependent methyltransferase [Spirulina sp. SIO3F2]